MQTAQPPVASWAQMAGAMAASWTSPRGSHFGVTAHLLWNVEGPGLRQPGVPVLLGYGFPHLCSRLGGPTVGPGPWESWGRVLAADKHTAHHWEHYLWLHTRMTGSDSFSSGTVPPARATPLTWARWGQPETAGQGLHCGIPSGWEGDHSQRPGMAAVGRRQAALGLRLEQIPPF